MEIKKHRTFSAQARRNISIGHGGTGILKEELMEKLCQCGCGNNTKPGNRFIIGHNIRGRVQSDEEKIKRSLSLSKSWETDFERKRKSSERFSGDRNPSKNPEIVAKIVKKNKGRKQPRETVEKMRNYLIKLYEEHPEKKKKISEKMKKLWQQKEFQEKVSRAMKSVYKNLEVRNKIREANKRLWQTEDYIKNILERTILIGKGAFLEFLCMILITGMLN